jgi:hypothetical protein
MAKKSEIVKMDFMRKVKEFLESEGETVLQVKSGTFSIPWALDGDEGYLNLTFSIPKGSREDGIPYDGYDEAENYRLVTEEKEKAKAEREEKKRKKIEKDRLAREKAKAKREERGKGGINRLFFFSEKNLDEVRLRNFILDK